MSTCAKALPMRPSQGGWRSGSEQQASGSSTSPNQNSDYFSYFSIGKSPLDHISHPSHSSQSGPFMPEDSTSSYYQDPLLALQPTGFAHPIHMQYNAPPYPFYPTASHTGLMSGFQHYGQYHEPMAQQFDRMSMTSQPYQNSPSQSSVPVQENPPLNTFESLWFKKDRNSSNHTPRELVDEVLRIGATLGTMKNFHSSEVQNYVIQPYIYEGDRAAFRERLQLLRKIYDSLKYNRKTSTNPMIRDSAPLRSSREEDAEKAITQLKTFENKWEEYYKNPVQDEETEMKIMIGKTFNKFLKKENSHLLLLGNKRMRNDVINCICHDFPDSHHSRWELARLFNQYLREVKPDVDHKILETIEGYSKRADERNQQSASTEHA